MHRFTSHPAVPAVTMFCVAPGRDEKNLKGSAVQVTDSLAGGERTGEITKNTAAALWFVEPNSAWFGSHVHFVSASHEWNFGLSRNGIKSPMPLQYCFTPFDFDHL